MIIGIFMLICLIVVLAVLFHSRQSATVQRAEFK